MKKIICSILFLSFFFSLNAQDNTCAYIRFHNPHILSDNIEKFFPPEIIKNNNIKKATAKYYANDTFEVNNEFTLKIGIETLNQYEFNENGYSNSMIIFQNGQAYNKYQVSRNQKKQITQHEFYMLDSKGNARLPNDYRSIADYSYDKNMMKKKIRQNDGIIGSDSVSSYDIITTDEEGRIIEVFIHNYYVYENTYRNTSRIIRTYNNKKFESYATYFYNSDSSSKIDTIQYNKNWQPLVETYFSKRWSNCRLIITYQYNENGAITSKQVQSIGPCFKTGRPDGDNYSVYYEYFPNQLLKRLTYYYEDNYCILNYIYK